jgi:hypothetical protein
MVSLRGSEGFIAATHGLGVVDVRSIEMKCILILTAPDTDDENLDAIRVLAMAAWPDIPIMIGRRAASRDTGTHRIVDRAWDLSQEWQPDETG